MEQQLFTWEGLATMGGASLLTFFIVQYTKNLVDRIKDFPTDLYAVFVAAVILLLAQFAMDGDPLDWRIYALSLANGFLIAAAAGQMERKANNPPKPKGDDGQ